MTPPLIAAFPSKGRLHEQTEAWLADAGLALARTDGERGYGVRLAGVEGVEARLLSPRDIAQGLETGDIHVGVTGEDLIQEESAAPDARVFVLRRLGFGRADVVVAAPESWLDVETMADLEDVAAQERVRTGRQMRVATKYARLTRRFFAARGLSDYRIVESFGATEGAPATGEADIIVDITSTGATLAANHLKALNDGLILRSEAVLAASLTAPWPDVARVAGDDGRDDPGGAPGDEQDLAASPRGPLDALRRFLDLVEARARARDLVEVRCAGDASDPRLEAAASAHAATRGAKRGVWVCHRAQAAAFAARARDVTRDDVVVTAMSYDFSPQPGAFARFLSHYRGDGASVS